ncbi:hypothetical protein A244_01990 [Pseudomonas syringae pv. actinidiae ICMP 18807]|uniref:Uncharacterized protein n=1 Tax=Pseudomonas syringae pv. actinidiae ICMP 18807 TaxID=1194404 RepID=S6V5T8_PSESF|nr:hypothetical protein A244_01990 [Pseudomonas syringae pv. actinidiae ICMP 18807]
MMLQFLILLKHWPALCRAMGMLIVRWEFWLSIKIEVWARLKDIEAIDCSAMRRTSTFVCPFKQRLGRRKIRKVQSGEDL